MTREVENSVKRFENGYRREKPVVLKVKKLSKS